MPTMRFLVHRCPNPKCRRNLRIPRRRQWIETTCKYCGKKFVAPPTALRPTGLSPVAHNAKQENEQIDEVQVQVQRADDGGLLGC